MKYSFIRLLKNIRYLMKYSLKEREKIQKIDILESCVDVCRYELLDRDNDANLFMLNILDYDATVDLLIKRPKSFCRFGDIDIEIMNGNDMSYQNYDVRLSETLLDILHNNSENLYVGINYNYFHSLKNLNEINKQFYLLKIKPYREFLLKHCNRERTYIAAGFNQLYAIYENYDFKEYYDKVKELFRDRELVIFAGKGILNKLQNDVFEYALSKEIVEGPRINAYKEYESLLEKALSYPKSKTLIFILGPCAKALVYELSKHNYIAWDLGHIAKDYDMYMKCVDKTYSNISEFFKPD